MLECLLGTELDVLIWVFEMRTNQARGLLIMYVHHASQSLQGYLPCIRNQQGTISLQLSAYCVDCL